MRATMRITWLLLSLSFLCHIVCSNGQSVSAPTKASDPVSGVSMTTLTLTISTAASNLAATTGATTAKVTNSQIVTTINPASTATPAATIKPSTPPGTTQPPPSTSKDTNKQSGTTSIISGTTGVPVVGAGSVTKGAGTPPVGGTTQGPTPSGKTTPAGTINTSQPTAVPTTMSATGKPDMSQATSVSTKHGTQQAAVTPTSGGQVTARDTTWTTQATITSSVPNKAEGSTAQTPTTTTRNKTPTISLITTPTTSSAPQPHIFVYPPLSGQVSDKDKDLATLCKQLTAEMKDTKCTLVWRKDNNKVKFDLVEISGKVKAEHAAMHYEEITRKPTDNKTLIAILASCGALLIMIVIFAVCASHHRKPYHENQQHLTEELHTVENGYHDNPTLEVMEVQPEMQEKKMALNGEFNDSWIVPIDNLLKEDIPDEEDTHL